MASSSKKVSIDDGSISKMSGTSSKFMEMEEHFLCVTSELKSKSDAHERDQAEQKALLLSIMELLKFNSTGNNINSCPDQIGQGTVGRQTSTLTAKVKPLTQSQQASGIMDTAGSGS